MERQDALAPAHPADHPRRLRPARLLDLAMVAAPAARPLADEPVEVGHPAEADWQLVG